MTTLELAPARPLTLARIGRAVSLSVLPIIVGLFVAATTFGGKIIPWRPTMVDFDVYRLAGRVLLEGGDFYHLPGSLPFLYPPFAALMAVPLALTPAAVGQIAWTVANVVAMLAILYRLGLTGWVLSLVAAASIFFVEPVSGTFTFGQLGIFLVALIVLDLVPGPQILGRRPAGRRLLPEGVLSGFATALKLTPGIFLIYLVACRKKRAALTMLVTIAALTLITAVILPERSLQFWGRLAHGDTGLGHSIVYYTNQSVMADAVRVIGLGAISSIVGLALSAVVTLLGIWAGLLWHRVGNIALSVTLCGIAGLFASPVSWSHHFVWVVPFAICLIDRRLPVWFRYLGWIFVGWVVAAPFKKLPNGGDVELSWSWSQNLLASVTAILGITVIVASIVLQLQRRARAQG
ncbi:glycosyltransferase 87 family protein [Microlunatus panaciterrae]|uniref:Alpha-1,2-mannosyltransferase n=1 Tax=Microlunatus panaciterrae TaxID=400768 RepID=A0ABS2RFU9_9ACTN|nr:glycosyltransferase 87 family protein [Microlunatus panaciterrae]MBM7797618.1 alpha-1,2-mannosyltransferase [Microlunatus panaciterrae]